MEPTSAVPFAALARLAARGGLAALGTVVIPVTGHGLKAANKLGKLLGKGV